MTPVQLSGVTLRDATPADLEPLAQLHVDTFNETHLGPLETGPTVALRVSQWRDKLENQHATAFVLVLEDETGRLVGFAWVHPTSGGNPFDIRLNKIYLRREYQRRGLGRAMMKVLATRLHAQGQRSMALFTEPDNVPACSFYESLGAERVVGDDGKWDGMYGWRDLGAVAERLA